MIPVAKSPHHPVTLQGECNDLLSFVKQVTEFAGKQNINNIALCYRGQHDTEWITEPGLWRDNLSLLEQNEKAAIRELISVHPSEFASDQSMFEKLVRMQHFGLPTRLLDVTLNPLVALYFATRSTTGSDTNGCVSAFTIPTPRFKYYDSDSVSCLSNLANLTVKEKKQLRGIYNSYIKKKEKTKENKNGKAKEEFNETEICKRWLQFIKVEKSHFLPIIEPIDIYKPYFVKPKMSNRRIVAQFGAFIIYGLKRAKSIRYKEEIKEYRFNIPAIEKKSIRKSLDRIGINESTLFPELDRAAGIIRERYLFS